MRHEGEARRIPPRIRLASQSTDVVVVPITRRRRKPKAEGSSTISASKCWGMAARVERWIIPINASELMTRPRLTRYPERGLRLLPVAGQQQQDERGNDQPEANSPQLSPGAGAVEDVNLGRRRRRMRALSPRPCAENLASNGDSAFRNLALHFAVVKSADHGGASGTEDLRAVGYSGSSIRSETWKRALVRRVCLDPASSLITRSTACSTCPACRRGPRRLKPLTSSCSNWSIKPERCTKAVSTGSGRVISTPASLRASIGYREAPAFKNDR